MALYEYQCEACGEVMILRRERQRKDWLPICVVCGGMTRRLIGKPGILFKVYGFYTTDHRQGGGDDEQAD